MCLGGASHHGIRQLIHVRVCHLVLQVSTRERVVEMQRELDRLGHKLGELRRQRSEHAGLVQRLKSVKGGWKRAEFDVLRHRNAALTAVRGAMHAVKAHMTSELLRARSASQAARRQQQGQALQLHLVEGMEGTRGGRRTASAPSGMFWRGEGPGRRGKSRAGSRRGRGRGGEEGSGQGRCKSPVNWGAEGEGTGEDETILRIWSSEYEEGEGGMDVHTVAMESHRVDLEWRAH